MTTTTPAGAAFFRQLADGAIFRQMELIEAGADQPRIDLQWDLATLLHAAAKVSAKIQEMEK